MNHPHSPDIDDLGVVVDGWTMESKSTEPPITVKIHLPSVSPEYPTKAPPKPSVENIVVGPTSHNVTIPIV
jgi:hypothetical protein